MPDSIHSEARVGSISEKTQHQPSSKPKSKRFFRRRKDDSSVEVENEKKRQAAKDEEDVLANELTPVGFTELFRYVFIRPTPCIFSLFSVHPLTLYLRRFSTRTELIMDAIGLIAAAAAGAAQVSPLVHRLTDSPPEPIINHAVNSSPFIHL